MLNIALRAARKAGELIARAADQLDTITVDEKGANDFVTEIDRSTEREIIQQLKKAYPDHGFLGEEGGASGNPKAEYRWIIDPLDGTTNFVRGIPHFAVSIACEYRGQLEHAVVLDPIRREEFTASRGRGAQLNGRRIRVSGRKSLDGALIGTGIPFQSRGEQHIPAYMSSLQAIAEKTAGVRRAGAAALDLAYVAAGRLDAFWEIGLQPWDTAAGVLLIREAGGLVSDFNGGSDYLDNGHLVCGNPKCFKALLQLVQPHLGHLR
jgi:myo-inositol-1(or 4)-monophosphatase